MAKKKIDDRMTPTELNKMRERLMRLVKNLQKIRERKSDYNQRVIEEIVKPVKKAAEMVFKKRGLKKPIIIVVRSRKTKRVGDEKPKIDIKKIAQGLGAKLSPTRKKIAEMKKRKYPFTR